MRGEQQNSQFTVGRSLLAKGKEITNNWTPVLGIIHRKRGSQSCRFNSLQRERQNLDHQSRAEVLVIKGLDCQTMNVVFSPSPASSFPESDLALCKDSSNREWAGAS